METTKKVFWVNGSPSGNASNSRKLASSFLEGYCEACDAAVTEFVCADHNIAPCTGCRFCWRNSEGRCAQEDDMDQFIASYLSADVLVWSFPVYMYSVPAITKSVMERLLPCLFAQLEVIDEQKTVHKKRWIRKAREVYVLATAGFFNTASNIESVEKLFSLLYPEGITMICCPEGDLLTNSFLRFYVESYLSNVRSAGKELASQGSIIEATGQRLLRPILPLEKYLLFTNLQGIYRLKDESNEAWERRKLQSFMRCLSLTYRPELLSVDRAVLAFDITDKNYQCQLVLSKAGAEFLEDENPQYDLLVRAPCSFFTSVRIKSIEQKADLDWLIQMANRCAFRKRPKQLNF
ncbi:MAG: flavodoxin family protein [Oscillospiraceae bacterium]|nr:flavodoxin family protein [Oscillospiraceae bacterium]